MQVSFKFYINLIRDTVLNLILHMKKQAYRGYITVPDLYSQSLNSDHLTPEPSP